MVDVPLGSVHSATERGGHGGLGYGAKQEKRAAVPGRLQVAVQDEVRLHAGRGVALQLLRERVLATTRALLAIETHHTVAPAGDEPMPSIGDFLSRLLSEQNQLAAARAGSWEPVRIRRAIVDGMQNGAADALDVLESSGRFEADAVQVIAEVLAEFGHRLAALAAVVDRDR
jgi:hypothetical protein